MKNLNGGRIWLCIDLNMIKMTFLDDELLRKAIVACSARISELRKSNGMKSYLCSTSGHRDHYISSQTIHYFVTKRLRKSKVVNRNHIQMSTKKRFIYVMTMFQSGMPCCFVPEIFRNRSFLLNYQIVSVSMNLLFNRSSYQFRICLCAHVLASSRVVLRLSLHSQGSQTFGNDIRSCKYNPVSRFEAR